MQFGGPWSVFTNHSLCLKGSCDKCSGVVGHSQGEVFFLSFFFTFLLLNDTCKMSLAWTTWNQEPLANFPFPPWPRVNHGAALRQVIWCSVNSHLWLELGLAANKALWHARASATSKQACAAICLQSLGGNYERSVEAGGFSWFLH